MKSFNVREAPGRFAAVAGILAFILVFPWLAFDKYLARQGLSNEANLLLRGFQDAMDSARVELAALPSIDGLNCTDGMSSVLGNHIFGNHYIRFIAVMREGAIICRGTSVGIDIPAKRQLLRLDDEWSFLKVRSPDKTNSLMLVQKRGDLEYVALFEPLIFDFLSAVDCRECVSYNLVLGAHSEIEMNSEEGSAPSVVSYTVDHVRRYGRLKLTLLGTKEYVHGFRTYGRWCSAAVATLIALAIGSLVYSFLLRRTSLTFLLKQGIKREEFLPYYQPIVDCRDGTVLGAEALARWRMHDGHLVPPAQFIQIAEETRLIQPITEQLMKHVLADMERFGWRNVDRYISINAVAHQITDSPFCDQLLRLFSEGKVSAKNLAVELTERHQLPDLDLGRRALSRLVEAGIRIQLDDAGTGFGGFLYVQELPIQILKIDKMFIDTLRIEGDAKRDVLEAIIEFARTSGLKTIAEGVETQEQIEHLKRRGVYAIQGYVYARPMPAEDFIQWLGKMKVEAPLQSQSL